MFDQADRLRQLVRETVQQRTVLEPGVPLVAVTGAAPRVGATTVAVQLARELTRFGKRTVLVDGQLLQPTLAAYLGLTAQGGIREVLAGHKAAVEVLEPVCEGIQLLAGGPTAVSPQLQADRVGHLIHELRGLRMTDLIIFDLGSGMSPWTARLWSAALQILLVTGSDSRSLLAAYTTVKAVASAEIDGRLRLVINRCLDSHQGSRAGENFAATCREHLGMKLLGNATLLPPDDRLKAGELSVSNSSDFRRALRLLAADVLSQAVAVHSCRIHAATSGLSMTARSQAAQLVARPLAPAGPAEVGREGILEKTSASPQED